jgi:hypothetical protein
MGQWPWIVVAAVLVFVCLFRMLRGPRPHIRPSRRHRHRHGDAGLFSARAWTVRNAGASLIRPGNYNRPADIELTDDSILPPPRDVRGINGE